MSSNRERMIVVDWDGDRPIRVPESEYCRRVSQELATISDGPLGTEDFAGDGPDGLIERRRKDKIAASLLVFRSPDKITTDVE